MAVSIPQTPAMKLFPALACLIIWVPAAVLAADGTVLDLPLENRPWKHEKTGLRFPDGIKDFDCQQVYQYDEQALGCSVRYVNTKLRVRADVYVYPCPLPSKTDEEMKNAVREEAGNVLGELEQMKRQGRYTKIERGAAEFQDFDLFPEGSGKSCLLTMPLNVNLIENAGAGQVEQTLSSFVGILLYCGHYVKIRCTFPKNDDKKLEKAVDEFVNQVRRLVLDPGLRVVAQEQIAAWRRDPFSEKGRDVAGGVLAYGEITPILRLTITGRIATLGEELESRRKGAQLDLMRAYIVGAVAASLADPPPKTINLPQAGAEEVLSAFALMKKEDPALKSQRLDTLDDAVRKKQAAAWLLQTEAAKQ